MSRLLAGMPWTPAVATDIRKTFAKAMEPDERKPDIEGALRAMRKIQDQDTRQVLANVIVRHMRAGQR